MSVKRTREIKFRGMLHYTTPEPLIKPKDATFATFLPQTVVQWTGTYDDEGKEIYEGDIIKADWCSAVACPPGPSFTGIVLYINKAAAFYVVREDELACQLWQALKTRVLGNVFDKEYKGTFGRIWDMNGDFLKQEIPEKKERFC